MTQSGSMCSMKRQTETPDWPNRNRFCGLPKGMRREPRIAAMFSMVMTGRIQDSLSQPLKRRMVTGTKMIRDTSLVTNMDEKNTPKIRNRESAVIFSNREARRIRGFKTCSCLNPSRTQSIIRRVPSVRQSISDRSLTVGGVRIMAMTAAVTDTTSMGSLLRNEKIRFIKGPSSSSKVFPLHYYTLALVV